MNSATPSSSASHPEQVRRRLPEVDESPRRITSVVGTVLMASIAVTSTHPHLAAEEDLMRHDRSPNAERVLFSSNTVLGAPDPGMHGTGTTVSIAGSNIAIIGRDGSFVSTDMGRRFVQRPAASEQPIIGGAVTPSGSLVEVDRQGSIYWNGAQVPGIRSSPQVFVSGNGSAYVQATPSVVQAQGAQNGNAVAEIKDGRVVGQTDGMLLGTVRDGGIVFSKRQVFLMAQGQMRKIGGASLVPESAAASCVTPGHDLLAFTNGVILRYANNSLTGASQLDGCTILSYAPAPGRLNAMSAVVRNEAGRTSALELRGEAEYGVAARVIPDTGNAAVSIALPQQGSNINTLYLFAEPGKLTLKQR